MYATGLKEEDMNKAQVGISSVGTHLPTIRNSFGEWRDINRMFDIL